MKKTNLIKSILMVACCVFFMAGCQNNAVADDGTNIRDYSKVDTGSGDSGSGGGGGAGGAGWDSTFAESGYDIFDYQSWGDYDAASEMSFSDAGMKITRTGAWAGGGVVSSDISKKFDFTGIVKIRFDIRGVVGNGRLFIQKNSADVTASTVQIGGSVLSETEYKSMEMNVGSVSTAKDITNCFAFVIEGNDKGGVLGNWFEVKNIKFVDKDGNSVKLTAK